jgi:hypothetical protein
LSMLLALANAEGSSPEIRLVRSLDHCSSTNKSIQIAVWLGDVKKEDKLFEYEIFLSYDSSVVYSPGVIYNNTLAGIWGDQNYTSAGDDYIASNGGTVGVVNAANGNKPLVVFSFLYRDGICADARFELTDLYLGTGYLGPVETESLDGITLDVKSIVKDKPERFAKFDFDVDTLDLDAENMIRLNLNIGEYKFLDGVSFEIESSNADMFIKNYTYSDNVEISDVGLGSSLIELDVDLNSKGEVSIDFEIDSKKIENQTENDRIDYSQFEIKNVLFNECNCIKAIDIENFSTKITTPGVTGIREGNGDNVLVLGERIEVLKNIRDIKIIDLVGRIIYTNNFLQKGELINLENKESSVFFIIYQTEQKNMKFNKIIIN